MECIKINFSDALVAPFQLIDEKVPDCMLYRAWFMSKTQHTLDEFDQMKKQFVLENRLQTNQDYEVEIFIYDERLVKQQRQRMYEINYLQNDKIYGTLRLTFLREVQDEI